MVNQPFANDLNLGGKMLLRLTIMVALASALISVVVKPQQARAQSATTSAAPLPAFEVASIKPNRSGERGRGFHILAGRFAATNVTTKMLVTRAYNVRDLQVSGGPSWMDTEAYDINAREDDAVVEKLQKLPRDQREEQIGLMLQSLLADRFKLKVVRETKELPVYALLVAKNGPKLQQAKPGDIYPNGIKGSDGRGHAGMVHFGRDHITGQGIPLACPDPGGISLVVMLTDILGRTVLDQTGLKGNYDINLQWTPDQSHDAMFNEPDGGRSGTDNTPPPDASGPSIFTALQQQLGLRLESTKGPVDVLVIDHIERPSEN
jgi:uncharacterized protein (TIGR03435 family)